MLLSQIEFARRCGVGKSTIHGHLRPGRLLAAALVKRGRRKRIDIFHPCAIEYLKQHGVAVDSGGGEPPGGKKLKTSSGKGKRPGSRAQVRPASSAAEVASIDRTITEELGEDAAQILARMKNADLPDDPTDYYGWSLRDIIKTFGASESFKRYLDCAKIIETIDKERAAGAIKKSILINRSVFIDTVFGPLETLCQRLVGDMPRTLARQLLQSAKAGDSEKLVEAAIRKRIKTELVAFKGRADADIARISIEGE